MQTWEYAPQYALRTYAYLYPMVGIAKVWQFVLRYLPWNWKGVVSSALFISSSSSSWTEEGAGIARMELEDDKPLLFALLRSTLASLACISELYFLDALYSSDASSFYTTKDTNSGDDSKINNTNHQHRRLFSVAQITAHLTAFIGLFASGNFHAMGSYLPSATAMSLWKMSASDMLWNYEGRAILWAIVAVLATGWPFCAALFLPIGIRAVWYAGQSKRKTGVVVIGAGGSTEKRVTSEYENNDFNVGAIVYLIVRSFFHAIVIGFGVALVDYHSYGFWAFPTWNIFVYNSQGGGDELYGVEPFSYYLKNLALNFNVVSLLGVMALPLVLLLRCGGCSRDSEALGMEAFLLLPMYIWMALLFPRPHKEERFLYPIYPMLSYGAAITVREGMSILGSLFPTSSDQWRREEWSIRKLFVGVSLLNVPAAISISRSLALHRYYSAPVEVYREMFYHALADTTSSSGETYVCTVGEWYRFPSSFFLPMNHKLGYLKSSFDGQLPQPFTLHGSRIESLAMPEAGHFNDKNEEEMDRYVDIGMCSYVFELVPMHDDDDDVPEGMRYMASDTSGGSWELLASRQFLDAEKTPALHRILYIPSFGSTAVNDAVAFKRYNVYERRR